MIKGAASGSFGPEYLSPSQPVQYLVLFRLTHEVSYTVDAAESGSTAEKAF